MTYLHQAETDRIIGAAIEVHRALGPGYVESVYDKALALELTARAIPFEQQPGISVRYRDVVVGLFRPDFIVSGKVIVEMKAVKSIDDAHVAVGLTYLKASGLDVGLILNFSQPVLKIKRVATDGLRNRAVDGKSRATEM